MSYETNFHQVGEGFVSVRFPDRLCPPYVIAHVALNRLLEPEELRLPKNFTADMLGGALLQFGRLYEPVYVTPRQAKDLRFLGEQVCALDEESLVEPPLDDAEKGAIAHLLRIIPGSYSSSKTKPVFSAMLNV